MSAMEFAATIGFDALRIAMGGKPKHHDVETICRWLRHVTADQTDGGVSNETAADMIRACARGLSKGSAPGEAQTQEGGR